MLRIALALIILFGPVSAHAEPVPAYALDKDYQNCMGGETDAGDPDRAEYCNCVRDGMRHWDMDQYGAAASAGMKSPNAQGAPQDVEALAKACIQKVLK